MNQREITTHGWTLKDQVRAEQIRTDRGMARMVFYDEVDPSPWNGKLPRWEGALSPWRAAGADVTTEGLKVTLFRVTRHQTEGERP